MIAIYISPSFPLLCFTSHSQRILPGGVETGLGPQCLARDAHAARHRTLAEPKKLLRGGTPDAYKQLDMARSLMVEQLCHTEGEEALRRQQKRDFEKRNNLQ